MAQHNAPTPADKRIEFRIGINMGDIVVEDGDIFGDGVNVAAAPVPTATSARDRHRTLRRIASAAASLRP
jgi:hypothetical protein